MNLITKHMERYAAPRDTISDPFQRASVKMDRITVHDFIRGCQDEQLKSRCDPGQTHVSSVSSCQLVVIAASY